MIDKAPFNLQCHYNIEPYIKHPTLLATHTVELIRVPDYAVEYTIDFLEKIGVFAALEKDYRTLTSYGFWPRYVVRGDLFDEPEDPEKPHCPTQSELEDFFYDR